MIEINGEHWTYFVQVARLVDLAKSMLPEDGAIVRGQRLAAKGVVGTPPIFLAIGIQGAVEAVFARGAICGLTLGSTG